MSALKIIEDRVASGPLRAWLKGGNHRCRGREEEKEKSRPHRCRAPVRERVEKATDSKTKITRASVKLK